MTTHAKPFLDHPINFILTVAVFLGTMIAASGAFAFGDVVGQQQQQGQQQGQKQGQIQGQYQTGSQANSQTTKYQDERQLAPVLVAPPSFGAAIDGIACAGTEAWSVGIGGAFFVPNGTGAPVSAGVGFGSSEVVTINLCEVRQAASQAASRKDEAMHYQIMCQTPAWYRADQALGRNRCKPTAPYEMEVVTEQAAAPTPVQTASRAPFYCEITDPRCDGS